MLKKVICLLLHALLYKLCIANYVYAFNICFKYRYELHVKIWKSIPLYTLSNECMMEFNCKSRYTVGMS